MFVVSYERGGGEVKGQKEERKGCRPDLAGGRKDSSNSNKSSEILSFNNIKRILLTINF